MYYPVIIRAIRLKDVTENDWYKFEQNPLELYKPKTLCLNQSDIKLCFSNIEILEIYQQVNSQKHQQDPLTQIKKIHLLYSDSYHMTSGIVEV